MIYCIAISLFICFLFRYDQDHTRKLPIVLLYLNKQYISWPDRCTISSAFAGDVLALRGTVQAGKFCTFRSR